MSATTHLRDRHDRAPGAGSAVVRGVRFVCPLCGEDRDGLHVAETGGAGWVECNDCSYRCDPGVLEIPTEATLAEWHAQALRHGQAALRCADGTPHCSYLATVWCRRLAPELSLWGKAAFLDHVVRPIAGRLDRHQRDVVLQLGVALKMSPIAINRLLDAV
jgi:hypothetical protein